jgi:hypothetical protein
MGYLWHRRVQEVIPQGVGQVMSRGNPNFLMETKEKIKIYQRREVDHER